MFLFKSPAKLIHCLRLDCVGQNTRSPEEAADRLLSSVYMAIVSDVAEAEGLSEDQVVLVYYYCICCAELHAISSRRCDKLCVWNDAVGGPTTGSGRPCTSLARLKWPGLPLI